MTIMDTLEQQGPTISDSVKPYIRDGRMTGGYCLRRIVDGQATFVGTFSECAERVSGEHGAIRDARGLEVLNA